MLRRAPGLVILVALASGSARAEAPSRPRVLVLKVRAEEGISQGTANLIGEILIDDIHRSGKYDALSTADMVAMLDVEQQKQVMGCEDTGCLADIGSAMGADLILEASMGTVGVTRVLAVKVIEVRKVQVMARETETVTDDEALIGAAHRLVAKVLDLPVPVAADSGELRPGWFVVAGGALLVGAGVVLGVSALGDYRSFEERPFDDALGDSAKGKALFADGLYAGGLVALAAGAIWLLTSGSPR